MRDIYNKYGAIIFIFITLYLSYLILKPFLLSIISSAIIAYIFYPIYKVISSKTGRKNLSSLLMIFVVLIIFFIPSVYLITSLIKEIPGIYSTISNTLQTSEIWSNIYQTFSESVVHIDLKQIIQSVMINILNFFQGILLSLPNKLINLSISAFLLFFFFRDGYEITQKLLDYSPFHKKDTTILIRQLKGMTDAVIYGQMITALVQAILATLAYYVLGFKAPLFFGFITLFTSIIPMLGPAFVYVPLGVSTIITSVSSSDTTGLIKGIIVIIYGIAIISSVDNVLKPILISDKVKIHPVLVMIGILGGLAVFGFIGVVIGPLILIFLLTLLRIYDMKERVAEHMEYPNKEENNNEGL